MSIGEQLRRHRESRGLSRAALARRCCAISPGLPGLDGASGGVTIKYWEDEVGRRVPSAAQLDVLLDALDVPLADRWVLLRLCRDRLQRGGDVGGGDRAPTASSAGRVSCSALAVPGDAEPVGTSILRRKRVVDPPSGSG